MKSKVQFDLNGLNEAVITAKVAYTEDVRDKVAQTFTERLGYDSILATVYFIDHLAYRDDDGLEKMMRVVEIKPVGSYKEECERLAALMGDEYLDRMYRAIGREVKFRKRTSMGNMSYMHGQPVADGKREYLDEDNI